MYSGIFSATYSEDHVGKKRHYHDGHQLLYIAKGSAEVLVNGSSETVSAGTLLLFSRFEEHSVYAPRGEYCRYSVRIAPDIPNTPENELLFSLLVNRAEGFCRTINVGDLAPKVESILQNIVDEFQSDRFFKEEMLDALLRELLIVICRLIPREMIPLQNENARLIYHLQKKFENGYAETFTLSELAAEYHMSVSHLSHLFKEMTGESVMEYLFACRMLAAKKFLATTEMPIGEIVSVCGFGDDSNFSRNFRKRTGMTPSEFRAAYRN